MKKSKQKRKTKKSEEKLFVPNEVLRTFKDLFFEVELDAVTWSWEVPYKIYEAEFEREGVEYEVEIAVTGYHLLTEFEIPVEELPKNVAEACAKQFKGWKISEVELVEYSNEDVCYEIELSKEKDGEEEEKEVIFREDGMFIGEMPA